MLGDPNSRPQSRPLAFTRARPPPGRPPSLKWEIAWEAQSGRLQATTSALPPPPHPLPVSLSSFSRLRSRNHQPNLPPFTSDTLSGDSNTDSGARGVGREEEEVARLV